LLRILHALDQQERLTAAALVSRAWHDAAVAATDSARVRVDQRVQYDRCMAWLERSAGHHAVASLELAGSVVCCSAAGNQRVLTQPLELRLVQCLASVPAVTAGLTSLTSLELDDAVLLGGGSDLAQLPQLVALQHLEVTLQYVRGFAGAPRGPGRDAFAATFPAGVLSSLVRLTHLELSNIKLDSRALDGLWHLHRLQGLCLADTGPLDFSHCMPPPTAAVADGDPAHAACQLRAFEVVADLQKGSTRPLLAYLQQQTQLTQLSFRGRMPCVRGGGDRYAALTASTQLQVLRLDCTLPAQAWGAMFSAGRQLPALTRLAVCTQPQGTLHTERLWDIIQSCPQLEHVRLQDCLAPSFCWLPLARLERLTSLTVSDVEGPAAVSNLALLTSLRSLSMELPNSCSWQGVCELRALEHVTSLVVHDDWLGLMEFSNTVSGAPPCGAARPARAACPQRQARTVGRGRDADAPRKTPTPPRATAVGVVCRRPRASPQTCGSSGCRQRTLRHAAWTCMPSIQSSGTSWQGGRRSRSRRWHDGACADQRACVARACMHA
jgi:hypothetical protein